MTDRQGNRLEHEGMMEIPTFRGGRRRLFRLSLPAMLAAVLVLLCTSAPRTGAEVLPDARPLLGRLEKALAPLNSLEADFVQVRHLALTDENVEATGRLRFLAPGFFRLDYRTPDPDVLTMRGDSLQVYFAALEQAQRYLVDENESTRDMFLLFASKPGRLERKYDISLGPRTPEGQPLRFQPLDSSLAGSISEIWVHLEARTGYPERIFFREEGGDTVLFRLAKTKPNRKMDAADFVFVPPPGTEIISR